MSTEKTIQTKVQIISDTEIYAERLFNAPVELVYKAHTDPELLPKWWGIKSVTTIVDQMDVRVDGTWRFVHNSPDAR